MVSSFSPEIELLICCARTSVYNETAKRIRELIHKELDWEYLFRLARMNGVVPLLYRSVKETCPKAVSSDNLKRFQVCFIANARRNLFLTGKILRLLELLKRHNIFAVPLKGPVLTDSVYGDLLLRSFSDLDILIYERDALKAYNLLISQGYNPGIRLENSQFRVYQKTEDQISVVRDDIRLIVDLHWKMVGEYSSFTFDLDSVRDRLELVTFGGKKVLHLCPEELLLYLCIHGAQHCWEKLDLICCVAEMVQSRHDLDWIRVTNLARKGCCERMLFLGLFLTYDLLGATIPVQVLKRIESDRKIKKLASTVYNNLFHESSIPYKNRINPRFSFFHIEVRERFLDKIRYGLYLVLSPTKKEWKLFPLPAKLSFLHYPLRPIRLSVRLMLLLLRRGFNSKAHIHFRTKKFNK